MPFPVDRQVLTSVLVALILVGAVAPAATAAGEPNSGTEPSPAASTAAAADSVRLEGAAIPMSAGTEQRYLTIMEKLVESDDYDVESRDHVFRVRTPDGISVVYSDADVAPAEVTVKGTEHDVAANDGSNFSVVFASSVDASTTAESVEFQELYENTSDYQYDVVEIDGNYRQLTYKSSIHGVETKERRAVLTQLEQSRYFGTTTGRLSRWVVLNLTANAVGDTPEQEAYDKLVEYGSIARITQQRESAFWMDGEMSVRAIVLPDQNGAVRLYLVDVAPEARQINDVSKIRNDDDYEDEIVEFTTQVVGERTDAHSRLADATDCSDPTRIRANGEFGCVASETTVVTHSGTLFEQGASETEMVKYTGLSTVDVAGGSAAERGEYRVTGRVIPGEYLDPRYAGQNLLLVYEMERVGPLDAEEDTIETAEDISEQLSKAITEQIESTDDEWEEKQESLAPADLTIENASLSDEHVVAGNSTTASVTVVNDGNATGALTVGLSVDGETVKVTDVRLASGEETTVTFAIERSTVGTVRVLANEYIVGDLSVYETSEDAEAARNSTSEDDAGDGTPTEDGADDDTGTDSNSSETTTNDSGSEGESDTGSTETGGAGSQETRTTESGDGGLLPGSSDGGAFTGGWVFFVVGAVVLIGGPLGVLGLIYVYN